MGRGTPAHMGGELPPHIHLTRGFHVWHLK